MTTMNNSQKKIQALKQAASDKRYNTVIRVETALRIMREKNLPINFESVAKLAGVSIPWLYRQENLFHEICSARGKEGKIKRVVELKSVLETKEKEIKTLKEKNVKLKQKVQHLRKQIECVYGELYKLKNS